MFQLEQNKKQQLLNLCNDYNLPVSSADDITVLEEYLKMVSDEYIPENDIETAPAEKNEAYSRKTESAIVDSFRKIFKLKLQH
jgi:hypothetical protein